MVCPAPEPTLDRVEIGGLPVVTASRWTLADAIIIGCSARNGGARTPGLVFDVNGHALSLRASSPAYRAALDQAEIIHADGGFLVTLSRWLCPVAIRERSATTDLFCDIAYRGSQRGLRVFLLGGTEDDNARCARFLEHRYPGIVVAGRHHGYFDPNDAGAVVDVINSSRPDIVWVGLGKPREQIFAARHRFAISARWVITCGGCFEFFIGKHRRAPLWMQRANLEWLHRMLLRPRALFWRYLTTCPRALWLVLSGPRRPTAPGE